MSVRENGENAQYLTYSKKRTTRTDNLSFQGQMMLLPKNLIQIHSSNSVLKEI